MDDAGRRLFWLRTTIAIAFAIGLLLSAPLWIGPRTFPEIPVLEDMRLSGGIATALFAALFGLAALIVVAARPRVLIAIFLAIVVVFCLFDMTRWQPWVYQYSLMLAALALFSWSPDDADGRTRTLNVLRLIVASTYVFSGLQKVNGEFVRTVFPEMVEPLTRAFPGLSEPLYVVGMLAPALQVAFGLGLLTRRFRTVSLVVAVAMHVFILAMLGPFGANWNTIVWPWTAAMAVFDLLLFRGRDDFSLRAVIWTRGSVLHAGVLAALVVMPLLSFFNLWDSYLSSALYSGNLTDGFVYATDRGNDMLPESLKPHAAHVGADDNEIDIQQWATRELNVPAYPETRVHKRVARALCRQVADPEQLMLLVRESRLFRSAPETKYRCADL